ncbi:MAG TPA: hypothetical protein VF571_07875 [Pyrinomonadaceae bacterium]|jgi:photosystem II stability/assembly factor-like uncharacterized protein
MLKRAVSYLLLIYIGVLCLACEIKYEQAASFATQNKVDAARPAENTRFPFEYDPTYARILNQNEWMIADGKVVWITHNGGQSWEKSFEPSDSDQKPVNIRGLSFSDKETVFAATDDSLFRSDNFGETWYKQGELNFSANSIFFLNNKDGWAVATSFKDKMKASENVPLYEGSIYSTNNGGISWTKNKIDGIEVLSKRFNKWSLSDIIAFDSGKGFAVGDGIILQTDNYGENWNIADAEKYKYYKLGYLNEKVIWAVTTGGYREFSLTTDGGNKWQTISIPEANRDTAQFVEFLDEKTALVGLNDLYVITTYGKKWSKIENPFYIYYVESKKDGSLMALARDEKRSFALYSIDKGKTWKSFQ